MQRKTLAYGVFELFGGRMLSGLCAREEKFPEKQSAWYHIQSLFSSETKTRYDENGCTVQGRVLRIQFIHGFPKNAERLVVQHAMDILRKKSLCTTSPECNKDQRMASFFLPDTADSRESGAEHVHAMISILEDIVNHVTAGEFPNVAPTVSS